MKSREVAPDRSAQIARIAWLATFVVPLVLTALLLVVVKSTPAAPVPPSTVPFSLDDEFEGETEGDFELEVMCVEAEEELEADELAEEELEAICAEVEEEGAATGGTGGASPTHCVLRSANAHATTKNDKLKLTIGYTTTEPTDATVEIKQGATRIATLNRHLGRSGVLRYTKQLGENADGKLTVRIKPQTGAAGCPSRRLVLFPR